MPLPRKKKRLTAKDLQREATRARLLDAARRLFEAHGYNAVSTTEIAREAGVTHGLIHAHFHAKAGLLFELIAESDAAQTDAAWNAARAERSLEARIAAILRVFAEADASDPELLGVMEGYFWQWPEALEQRNREQRVAGLAPLHWALQQGVSKGELRADLDLDRTVKALFAIYTMTLRAAVFDDAAPAACADEATAQALQLPHLVVIRCKK